MVLAPDQPWLENLLDLYEAGGQEGKPAMGWSGHIHVGKQIGVVQADNVVYAIPARYLSKQELVRWVRKPRGAASWEGAVVGKRPHVSWVLLCSFGTVTG